MEFNVNRRIPVLAAGFSSGYQQQVLYVQQIRVREQVIYVATDGSIYQIH